MTNQVYEQLAKMSVTCKNGETKYAISYAVAKGPGQGPALHTFVCTNCHDPFEVLVPGKILEGPLAEPQNK